MWLLCMPVSSIRGFERAPGWTSMCCGLQVWTVVASAGNEGHHSGNTGILVSILHPNPRFLSCQQWRCHATESRLTACAKGRSNWQPKRPPVTQFRHKQYDLIVA